MMYSVYCGRLNCDMCCGVCCDSKWNVPFLPLTVDYWAGELALVAGCRDLQRVVFQSPGQVLGISCKGEKSTIYQISLFCSGKGSLNLPDVIRALYC